MSMYAPHAVSDVVVESDDVAGSGLPHLAFLRLLRCGPSADALAEQLVITCPELTSEGCVVCADGVLKHVSNDLPCASRTRAKHSRFPQEELAGCSLGGVLDALERGYTRAGW
jgi:hypothetical protein